MKFKKGDKIIWDSGFGYEIGYFIEESNEFMYHSFRIDLCTGVVQGQCLRYQGQIKPYNEQTISEMVSKYGYEKKFSKTF